MSNFWKKLLSFIFGSKDKSYEYEKGSKVKTIIPKVNSHHEGPLVKNYHKLKRTYHWWGEIIDKKRRTLTKINGRRVKAWLMVYAADDEDGDEYIPIFFKRKKHRIR